VALDLSLDDMLLREGRAREIVHAVQAARKNAQLQVEDRIELALDGDSTLLDAAREHAAYISGETLATAFDLGANGDGHSETAEIDGLALRISLRRARA
jgi:isoleucyl-tRNA synthetase